MKELGTVNNRKILYQRHNIEQPWNKLLPVQNWLALIIVSKNEKTKLFEIANKIIDNNACFICCAGEQSELLHDIADKEIVLREVDIDNHYLPPFDIITTWHADAEDGLWYATNAAYNDPTEINTIVCLDATEFNVENEIYSLIQNFNNGYIPA